MALGPKELQLIADAKRWTVWTCTKADVRMTMETRSNNGKKLMPPTRPAILWVHHPKDDHLKSFNYLKPNGPDHLKEASQGDDMGFP